jgi:hypothetical protein
MGWDIILLTQDDNARVFISHDEWMEFATRDSKELERITAELEKGVVRMPSVRDGTIA